MDTEIKGNKKIDQVAKDTTLYYTEQLNISLEYLKCVNKVVVVSETNNKKLREIKIDTTSWTSYTNF